MFAAMDNTATIQPLPRSSYVDVCLVEENPWRKLFDTGTGGSATHQFCIERLSNGATYQFVKLADNPPVAALSTESDIETLISLMKPSMAQLAAAFGVSRQRIYDWRNGAGMSSANTDQLDSLMVAARVLGERSTVSLDQIGSIKCSDGKNFWESIASGITAADAAENALRQIERNTRERDALKRSLESRRVAITNENPLFSAHLGS